MKAAKWREMSEDEVTQKVRELSEEIFNLRFQLTMGVAKNPSRIGLARRDLARAFTIIRERGGAPAAVAAAVAPVATAITGTEPAPKAGKKAKPAKARAAKPAKAARVSAKAKPKKKAKG
jgi:large subunit ribosomal protein L29